MSENYDKNSKIRVYILAMLVLLIFGFCFPDILRNMLDDLLWDGEDIEILAFWLCGALMFTFSGLAAIAMIKCLIDVEHNKVSCGIIRGAFSTFGVSYMALRIISRIEDYGILGSVVIEKNNLNVIKPMGIVLLILAVAALIIETFLIFNIYTNGNDNNVIKSFSDKLTKISAANNDDELRADLSAENIYRTKSQSVKNEDSDLSMLKKNEEKETEKNSISKSRLISTVRSYSSNNEQEKSDKLRPGGNL